MWHGLPAREVPYLGTDRWYSIDTSNRASDSSLQEPRALRFCLYRSSTTDAGGVPPDHGQDARATTHARGVPQATGEPLPQKIIRVCSALLGASLTPLRAWQADRAIAAQDGAAPWRYTLRCSNAL